MSEPRDNSVDIGGDTQFHDESSEDEELSSRLLSSSPSPTIITATKKQQKNFMPWLNLTLLSVNLVFIAYTVMYSWQSITWIKFQRHYCPELPFSPRGTGIKYENTIMHLENAGNPFAGELGPEVDKAWDELLIGSNIRVSGDELRKFGELGDDNVALANGEGYVGTLRVFHELHCMSWIKREYSNLNRSFEELDPSTKTGRYREEHFDHCLNVILQGVQCRADMTTSSWWIDKSNMNKPLINRRNATHTCVNWGSVQDWIRPRVLRDDAKAAHPSAEKVELRELFRLSKPT